MKKQFPCMVCEKRYHELEEAEVCERQHDALAPHGTLRKLKQAEQGLRLHLANPCAFCDGDPCRCSDGRPKVLAPEEILRLGALTLQQESSLAVEQLLEEQARVYVTKSKEELVEALVARDALLAHQGRQFADGRTGARLLREFMRAALYKAGGRPDAQAVQRVLEQFGAESADARQLKLHGSTLGPLVDPEQAAEKLVDGSLKERPGSATVREGALQKDR